jgi:hypothetical protein
MAKTPLVPALPTAAVTSSTDPVGLAWLVTVRWTT